MNFKSGKFISALLIGVGLLAPVLSLAATQNYGIATPGIVLLPFHHGGYSSALTVNNAIRFQLPFKARVIGFTGAARVSTGTAPTLTADLLSSGSSVLSAPLAISAGAVSEGTVSAPVVADESVMTVNFVVGGTTPTFSDIDLLITVIRE